MTALKCVLYISILSYFLLSICAAKADDVGSATVNIQESFSPSGWMGDGEYGRKYIEFSGVDTSTPHSPPTSVKVTYTFGTNRWAGLYWQNQPNNWGDQPGRNLSGKKGAKLTFWARGEVGNEVVEFKAGGISNKTKEYRDSFVATSGRQLLSREWKKYEIDLSHANLSSVIGGFCWVASSDYNRGKQVTFYLDDIVIE